MDISEFEHLFDKENYKRHPWEISRKKVLLNLLATSEIKFPIKRIVDSLKLDSNAIEIKITKSTYVLEVICNNQVIKTYPCVFGYGYPKDKLMKGDMATPEGRFLVDAFYSDISWSMFISLIFPNKASLEKIHKAKQQKIIPANARTGGSIGIHGTNPDSDHLIDQKYNWTHGCISLKRLDIIDLCTILKKYGNVVSIVK